MIRSLLPSTFIQRLAGPLAIASLCAFTFACNTLQDPTSRTGRRSSSGGGGADTGVVIPVSEIVAKYPIFDPSYNFLRTSNSNLGYAAQNFPVLTGQNAQITAIQLDDLLATRMSLLDSATKSVRVQVLIYWADEIGWLFTDKFISLKRKGIDVKIIIDPVVNMQPANQSMFFALEQAGITVEGYDPFFSWPLVYGGPEQPGLEGLLTAIDQRYHEKYFIIDGEIVDRAKAVTGGVNISKHYFRVDSSDSEYMWRDQDVMVTGPAAQVISTHFDQNFQHFVTMRKTKGILDFDSFWLGVQNLASMMGRTDLITIKRPAVNNLITTNIATRSAMFPRYNFSASEMMRMFRNRPRFGEFYIEDVHLDVIRSAKNSIAIDTAYFIPGAQMIQEILAAARRGVEVRILTNSVESSEYAITGLAARAEYPQLLILNTNLPSGAAPIQLYEWQGHKILGNNEGHHHSKFMVVDEELVVVGSYNLDPRSRNTSTENVIVAYNRTLASDLLKIFEDDIAPQLSKIITYDEAIHFQKPSADDMLKFQQGLIPYVKPYL